MKNIVVQLMSLLILTACAIEPEENGLGGYVDDQEYQDEFIDTVKKETTFTTENDLNSELATFSKNLINLLDEGKYEEFSNHFHPTKGCRFIPYTFTNSKNKTFSKEEFKKGLKDKKGLIWGTQDGSGEPINQTVSNYMSEWVYNLDFKNETNEIHINDSLVYSNSLNNISEAFPKAFFVEFYKKGTAEYSEMDWKSIIFYVEKVDGVLSLVAVANNQWTI